MFASAVSCGMDYSMIQDMTAGNLVDYILSWNELHGLSPKDKKAENKEPTVRMATQKDFDNF